MIIDQTTSGKTIAPLPQKYTSVLLAAFKTKKFKVPIINDPVQPSNFHATIYSEAKKKWKWLEAVMASLKKYVALRENRLDILVCIPFQHAKIKAVIPPPGQVTVLALDQPCIVCTC